MALDFYSFDETFQIILEGVKKGKSFIRLNDADFRIICGHRCAVHYQNLDQELREKLIEICGSNIDNLMICYGNFGDKKIWMKNYIIENVDLDQKLMRGQFPRSMGYVNGSLTDLWKNRKVCFVGGHYISSTDHDEIKNKVIQLFNESNIKKKIHRKKDRDYVDEKIKEDNKVNNYLTEICKNINKEELLSYEIHTNSFSIIKELLSLKNYTLYIYKFFLNYFKNTELGKERIIGCIDSVRYKNDLVNSFSNTKSIEFINNNFKNSYMQYNEIMDKCLEKEKETLFVVVNGPMGKLLIYNLFKKGYQSIDIGQGIGHTLC